MLLGAHVPTAGGLDQAPARGRDITADAIQVFTRNQVQWRARPLAPEEVRAFRVALAESGVRQVLSHGSYLVNLASGEASLLDKSRKASLEEMERCHALGIPSLVFHPGSHRGAGEASGLRTVAASLNHVLERALHLDVLLLLEVTAGQGSSVGHRFEHLVSILERVKHPERLGVCLDTCHLLAAGYDIATPQGYEATLSAFTRLVGLDKLKAVARDAGPPPRLEAGAHAAPRPGGPRAGQGLRWIPPPWPCVPRAWPGKRASTWSGSPVPTRPRS